MNRAFPAAGPLVRETAVGIIVLLASCLFGGTPAVVASRWLGPVAQELLATFHDPGTQWMVFGCCGVYFITLTLLQQRASGLRFWRWDNPDVWLAVLLGLAATRYALQYRELRGETDALVLLAGAVVGKAVAWVVGMRPNMPGQLPTGGSRGAEDCGLRPSPPKGKPGVRINVPVFTLVLLIFLVGAACWQDESGRQFLYRGQMRWSGPWANPNLFGTLMGVGVVLALGRLVVASRGDPGKALAVCGRWKVVLGWLRVGAFLAATGILLFGLLKSLSRGAWLGTAVGLGYLAWRWLRDEERQSSNLDCRVRVVEGGSGRTGALDSPRAEDGGTLALGNKISARLARSGRMGARWCCRNPAPLVAITVSLAVLAFWQFRHTEVTTVRRVFSVGNVNDFSWRNRVAAWVGALQIMAERPLTGLGWNQVEHIYDQFYRRSDVHEGMAVQLNDYLALGSALGIPALACFLASVWLSLRAKGPRLETSSEGGGQTAEGAQEALRTQNTARRGPGKPGENVGHPKETGPGATPDARLRTSDFRSVCRAGALVLLVAFWFDGGLFRWATATVFWLLLEMGRER